jgi:putative membrane protein
VGVAIVSLASIIETQLRETPEEMAGLFFGLVGGSVAVAQRMLTKRRTEHVIIVTAIGVITFWLLGFQSGPVTDPSPLMLAGAGALAICAMILPGISGSFILLMMGMYTAVLGAVHDRVFVDLALIGVGAVLGLAIFSSLLGWVLDRQFNRVMAALIGLMLGSLRVLWPWPNGVGIIAEDESEVIDGTALEWPADLEAFTGPSVLAVVGFGLVMATTQIGSRRGT